MSDVAGKLVWVSRAMEHASNQRPFRNDVAERDNERLLQIQRRVERGESLAPDELPQEIFGQPYAKEQDYQLPNLFYAYGFWVVSKAAADVLGQFDLGGASLTPVRVLRSDRQTPVDGEWLCLVFGNQKTALVPDESRTIHKGAKGLFAGILMAADNDVAVSPAALEPPDIWVDTQMWDAFFVSEALGKALRKAKVDQGFMLRKCRVVEG